MATRQTHFRILVATDGSAQARAAIATVVDAPWPARTRVRAIVRQSRAPQRSILLSALDRSADDAAARARRALARRWPVEETFLTTSRGEGLLSEAERFRADVIVVGWRGYGAVRRLLMGSVSRGVVRGAKCAVLVVRRRPRRVRWIRDRIRRISKRPSCGEVGRQVGGAPAWTGHAHQRRGNDGASLTRAASWWYSIDD